MQRLIELADRALTRLEQLGIDTSDERRELAVLVAELEGKMTAGQLFDAIFEKLGIQSEHRSLFGKLYELADYYGVAHQNRTVAGIMSGIAQKAGITVENWLWMDFLNELFKSVKAELISFEVEYGGVLGANGQKYDSPARARSTQPFFCEAGTVVDWSGGYVGYAMYYSSSSLDDFIALSDVNITHLVIPYDCYVMVACKHTDESAITDLDDVKKHMTVGTGSRLL